MKSKGVVKWTGFVALGLGLAWTGSVVGGCEVFGTCGEPCESECTTDEECTAELLDESLTECKKPVCSAGKCVVAFAGTDKLCGPNSQKNHCDGENNCVCDTAADCGDKTECQSWACSGSPAQCVVTNQATDLFADPAGDCTKRSCSSDGKLIEEHDDGDLADDDNECTADKCEADGTTSHAKLTGPACGQGPMCMGADLKPQDTCQDGVCPSADLIDCNLYTCDSGTSACKESCGGDADCTGAYCGGNTCLPKIKQGDVCSTANQCLSAHCADNLCCESACDSPCLSCKLGGGTPGKCSPLPKGVKDACIGTDELCDGKGQCESTQMKAVGQPCGADEQCFNNICTNGLCKLEMGAACEQDYKAICAYNFCRPDGTCGPCTEDSNCSPGICHKSQNGNYCKLAVGETCGANSHCLTDTCTGNVCVKGTGGKPCQSNTDCVSNICKANKTCQ